MRQLPLPQWPTNTAPRVALLLLLGGCPDGVEGGSSATEASASATGATTTDSGDDDGDATSGTTAPPSDTAMSTTGGMSTSTTGESSITTGDTPSTSSTDTSGWTTDTSDGGSTTGAEGCGDNVKAPDEECDLGEENGVGDYGGCNADCTLQPDCKDGEYQKDLEDCDPSAEEFAEAAICTDVYTWDGVIVFVSSESFEGDLGGLAGADKHCRDLADAAGLVMPEQYRAWLSVGGNNAADRIPRVDLPYYRLDGMEIAMTDDDLLDWKLLLPPNITEKGESIGSVPVWTNTAADGTTINDMDCQSFTVANGKTYGYGGLSGKTDSKWTEAGLGSSCSDDLHLYCFSASL